MLRNYEDPQTAVVMEGTGICKRIGKCDMFHVALFVQTFRATRYDEVVQLLWFISKSTLVDISMQICLFMSCDCKSLKFKYFFINLIQISSPCCWRIYPPYCGPANYSFFRQSVLFWTRSPAIYASLLRFVIFVRFVSSCGKIHKKERLEN